MTKRIRSGVLAAVMAMFMLLLAAAPSNALVYNYYVGHPMYTGGPGAGRYCTGSWAVYGTSGSFILTAGHCGAPGTRIYGTGSAFGTIAYTKYQNGQAGDSALVSYDTGVTPYQTIVDPRTGASPGNGLVTGKMSVWEQTVGVRVGMMGATSGWTEGNIVSSARYEGVTAICASYPSAGGDSGGPVWRNDANGLRAVGMHVGALGNLGCYIPIDTLLNQWGASMNFWPKTTARNFAADLMPDDGTGVEPPMSDGTIIPD